MRLHRSRFVSCLLITAFITTSATPAFALRPPAKKEAAGLEELDEALRSGDPADAATAAGALTTRLAGALGLTPSAPAAYAPAPASSVPAAGLEEDEDDELPPVTEEWGGPLSLTLALDSPTLDSRVVLAGMSSLGDLVWMSFTEIDHAGRPRVAFQVQGVPENVVVVRKGIIEKDLEVHRGSWSFMNDPALLRPIMDRQDFQEMLGRLRSKAHGAKQFDPNRPGGRLVVTFRYGDTQDAEEVILFDTRGDDPAAWRPFAVVKARPEGRWRARLIVRALQHVEIMRESVYRRGRTAPAAGLEEDEDDELPPVTEETVRDDLARHESGLADALSIGDTEGIETYTELIQSDHAKLEELGDAAGLEEARDTERPWQALIGEGKELSIEEANALLKQAAAAEGIGGLSYKPRESSRATWEHLNQTASTDQVRITRAIDAMAVNGRVHAAIRKGVAWIKSPAAGEGLPTAGLEESASPLSFPGVRQIAILGIREGTDGTDRVFPSLYNQSRAGVRKRLFPGMDPDARMPVLMGQAGQGRLSSLEMFFGETERYPTYDLVLVEQGYYALNRERLEEALRRSPSRQAVVVPFDQGKRYGEQELARLVVEAVRTEFSSAPYAVGVRLHGNHVSAALVNGKGKVVRTTALPAARWRDLPDVRRLLGNPPEDRLNDRILELIPVPKQGKAVVQQDLPAARAVADRITEEVVRHVVELVRNTGLPLGGLRRVRIGFAGSVNTETGAAGDPYASANIPGYDHYPLTQEVARGVESALGVKPEVDLLNDAPMGRKGEASPTGTAPGMPDAVFMIWGTGINTDGLDLPETGHGLVGSRREDGLFHYEYRDASQERPALAEGEFEVEQRLGGEVLKARFQQGGYADGAEVTTRAYEQDAGARRLIVDAGSEMGRAIAAGLALRYRQSGFIPRRFVLGAGVAEGLGRGVTDRQRRDLLIGAVQDAAYQELAERFQIPAKPAREIADSIVRTRMTSDERDFAAAGEGLPAAGLEEITPDTDVLELVKPGGLLTSPDGREFLVRRVDGDNNGIEVSPMIISEGTGEQYPADRIETLFRSLVGWRYAPPAAPLQETLRELREDPDQGDEEPDLPLSAEPPGEDLTGLEEEAMLMRVDDILDRIVYDESIRAVRTSGQSPNEALGRENDGVVEDRRIIRHGTLNRLASPLAEDGYVELRVRDGEAVLSAPTDWTLVRVLSVQAAVSAVTYDRRVQTVAHDTSTGVREISRQGEIPPYQAVDAAARQTAGAGETLRVKIKNGRALLLPPSANEDRPLPVGQAQGEIFSVRGGVRRVAFTRDAKHNLLAVATERVVPTDSSKREGEVVTFDWAASARRRWVHFKKSVLAVTFSQTQQGILTVTPEEAVRLNAHWEYAEESLPFALHLPPADQMYPHSLAFSPDRKLLLVTGRELSQARVQNLDIADAKKFEKRLGILVKLTPEWGKPISGAFHPDGKVVALGTSAGTVELWRLPAEPGGRAERLAEARWHGGAVRAALFSPNGRVLATGDSNGNVRLWRWDEPMQELIPLHSFSTAPGQPVHSVSFLPVGIADRGKPGEKVRDADLGSQVIAAAGQDGVVRFWDALQGRELARMGYGREPAPITSISFSPDGTKIAAGHAANDRGNGTLAIWKVPAAVSEFAASLSRPAPTPAAGLEEGSVLGVVGIVGRSPPLVRQLEQLAKSVRPELEGDVVTYIASGNEIWELDEERFVMTLERVGSIGNGAVIVAADASLAAPGDAAVKHVVGLLAAFQVPLRYIAQADRDDVALALAEMEQELEAEEAAAPQPSAGGKPAGLMIKGLRSPTGVTLSPDGRTLFVREFGIFSPDGRALFESGFGTGRVRAFSAADGRPTGLVIENIDGFDDGVALSPDGRTVFVGGGHSGRVRAFSAVDGAPTGLVIENIDGLDNVALSPD
ncbi:MAG: WD40 repeat domain-containing protein, partial [Candidatus Omnitrophica bacterium]|nr:WD40 repeat domain-containing protein [Candidatus Omnitrophota bacterium]